MSEIEYVELEEEILPALTIGVKRLSDGIRGLKLHLEDLTKQMEIIKQESSKLTKLLEENKKIIDNTHVKIINQYENLSHTLENFLTKLESNLKSILDLELSDVNKRLANFSVVLDSLTQEVYSSKLENKEKSIEILENMKILTDEIYQLKNKINDMNILIYSLEIRIRNIEEKITTELTELKLLLLPINMSKATQ
ncbi:MAG: hypothetical protein RMI04_04120 [Thermofilaceae archaeon]|nr:hypothetical protein [Thermofilaceae archaeon]